MESTAGRGLLLDFHAVAYCTLQHIHVPSTSNHSSRPHSASCEARDRLEHAPSLTVDCKQNLPPLATVSTYAFARYDLHACWDVLGAQDVARLSGLRVYGAWHVRLLWGLGM